MSSAGRFDPVVIVVKGLVILSFYQIVQNSFRNWFISNSLDILQVLEMINLIVLLWRVLFNTLVSHLNRVRDSLELRFLGWFYGWCHGDSTACTAWHNFAA